MRWVGGWDGLSGGGENGVNGLEWVPCPSVQVIWSQFESTRLSYGTAALLRCCVAVRLTCWAAAQLLLNFCFAALLCSLADTRAALLAPS